VTLARQLMPRVEFYHIVLVVTAAMMLLAQSNHFVMLFVALETLTIGLYILVSYFRTSAASLEAGLKYLVMGALSSGLLLFGIVLLYGVAGNPSLPGHTASGFHYGELARFLAANPHNFLASLGVALVLAGVAFKIGAFPFQIWIPDVYQGAPTPVTAFLAVASKAAGFAVLLALCGAQGVFAAYNWLVMPILTAMAAATILFGNVAALAQHNVKRLIGLSGVSHAGFLLLGVVAASTSPLATGAVYFYLFAYLLASFAVLGVMAHIAGTDDAEQELDHYAGLAKQNPFLAAVLAVGLGSLAGIPPLAGFMGKLFVFIAAYQAGARALLAIAALGVVVSIYYYFGWIKAAFFETWTPPASVTPPPARTPVGTISGLALGALALASIVLGFYQGPFGQWLRLR
jgi:NADH-quinone oxidoreductase subunit N